MPWQGGPWQPDPAATLRSHPHPAPASPAPRRAGVRWAARGAAGPSRGRACQPQPPPALPAPLSAPRAAPSRPRGVRALRGRARRRVWEERGGAGREAECRGGSCGTPGEEPLGDPRRSRCAAAAPGRAGASPLAVSTPHGGGARLSGGEGRGRAGAGPDRQRAAGARASVSRDVGARMRVLRDSGAGLRKGRASRQEREHKYCDCPGR